VGVGIADDEITALHLRCAAAGHVLPKRVGAGLRRQHYDVVAEGQLREENRSIVGGGDALRREPENGDQPLACRRGTLR